jgi:hypothetical protein
VLGLSPEEIVEQQERCFGDGISMTKQIRRPTSRWPTPGRRRKTNGRRQPPVAASAGPPSPASLGPPSPVEPLQVAPASGTVPRADGRPVRLPYPAGHCAMRSAPTVYRVVAICVFLMGFALHLTNVIIGPDRLVAEVFSPRVEIIFSFLMIVAATSGWLSLKRLANRGAMRVVFWFALVLITLSIPIHLRSVVLWSTAWVHAFPKYYSHVEVPMFLGLAYAVARFRFRDASTDVRS